MRLTRRHRWLTAFALLLSVLFTQVAVAAYACPGSDPAAAVAASLQGDAGCCNDMSDRDLPGVCKAHCEQDERSFDRPSQPSPASHALVALLPEPADGAAPTASPPPGEQSSLLARPTAPAVAVRHCCFRI